MQNEALFLGIFGLVVTVFIMLAFLLVIKRIKNSKDPNYVDPRAVALFKKQEREAKARVTNGIEQIATGTSLLTINEGMLHAHYGLDFFDAHKLPFGHLEPNELRETLYKISTQKVKRLYNFYQN